MVAAPVHFILPGLPRGYNDGMNDGDALLRAVIESPHDDHLLLVYADWLDDADEPVLADLIRADLGRPTQAMTALEARLRGTGRLLLEVPFHGGGRTTKFYRGLVSEVSCALAEWLIYGPKVAWRFPLRKVTLTDRRPAINGGMVEWYAGADLPTVPNYVVPLCLFDIMAACVSEAHRTYASVLTYQSRKEADDALSAALIVQARAAV